MDVRVANAGDASPLIEFNQAMALETEGKHLDPEILGRGVRAVFDDPQKGYYVVTEEGGRIIGALLVTYEWSDWRNGWFWWIQSVYIRPEFRGRKLYSRMYRFVKDRAAEAGDVCGFRLYVEAENSHARRVYENVGMEPSHYCMYEETS